METISDVDEGDLQVIVADEVQPDIPEKLSEASQCGEPIQVYDTDEIESEYFTLMECRDAYEEEAEGIESLYGNTETLTKDLEEYLRWIESLGEVDDGLVFID